MIATKRVLAATLSVVVLVACGSGGSTSTAVGSSTTAAASSASTAGASTTGANRTSYPVTLDNCGHKLTFAKAPERVVLLNGTSVGEVESFIVLGLQSHIVANSQSYGVSDDPTMVAEITKLPTGGIKLNENFEVPKEQLLAQKPDLVVSTWAGGFDDKIGSISRDELDKLGIASYVTPSNCAYGAANPTPDQQQALAKQSWENSYDLIRDMGQIFDVQPKATELIAASKARIAAASRPAGAKPVHVLLAYPGMSMMNANNLPAVFGGSLYDTIIAAAGGVNSFPGRQFVEMSNITNEQLAAAPVDVLVVGLFQPGEDAKAYADQLFAAYPQWNASKTKNFTAVSDSAYLGPFNAIAVEKIAKAVAGAG